MLKQCGLLAERDKHCPPSSRTNRATSDAKGNLVNKDTAEIFIALLSFISVVAAIIWFTMEEKDT